MKIYPLLLALVLCKPFTFGFKSPFDTLKSLPYGRNLRAIISGRLPAVEDSPPEDDSSWWSSLDRNNTINCKCGEYKTITDEDKVSAWSNEGIKSLNEYSWTVSLVSPGQDNFYSYCGGTLVNDRYVLTSATCIEGARAEDVEVLIGTYPNMHFPSESKKVHRKKVHRVITHPKFTSNVLDYNIALLRLQGPVPTYGEENGISPVCLFEKFLVDDEQATSLIWRFYNNDGLIVPGRKTEISQVILSKDECKSINYNNDWATMPDTMMCTKFERPDNLHEHPYYDSYDCPGDAGSGLFVPSRNKMVQVGIDSFNGCFGKPDGVGVYTRIEEFLPWIKLHISEDGRNCAY